MIPQFSEKTNELFKAIAAFSYECPNIAKDSKNPHFKSDYASLEDIWDVIKPLLNKHKLMVSQHPGKVENGSIAITTVVVHIPSEQFMISVGYMPMGKEGPQAAGSAITYGRRYFIAPILGLIAGKDDDGEAAEGRGIPAAKLGGLKERKATVLRTYGGLKKIMPPIHEWMSSVLGRHVDEDMVLKNEEEVKKLEEAIKSIT